MPRERSRERSRERERRQPDTHRSSGRDRDRETDRDRDADRERRRRRDDDDRHARRDRDTDRHRNRDRDRDRGRDRDRDRDRERARSKSKTSDRDERRTSGKDSEDGGKEVKREDEQQAVDLELDAALTPEEMQMMQAMGIPFGFESTQGKHIEDEGANLGGVKLKQKRQARQYMNRRGGFNRPLPAERTGEKKGLSQVLRD